MIRELLEGVLSRIQDTSSPTLNPDLPEDFFWFEDEGDEGCYHQMEPKRSYDIPDPDMRNPIRVDECAKCNREVHKGTLIGHGPIDTRYLE